MKKLYLFLLIIFAMGLCAGTPTSMVQSPNRTSVIDYITAIPTISPTDEPLSPTPTTTPYFYPAPPTPTPSNVGYPAPNTPGHTIKQMNKSAIAWR